MSWKSVRMARLRTSRAEVDPVCQLEKDQLDRLIMELEDVENAAKSAHQSAKNLTKQIVGANKLELTLANNLSSYTRIFTDDDTMCNLLEECNSYASLSDTSSNDFAASLKKAVLAPLELLKRAMNEIRAELRIYNSLELEVVKLQKKIVTQSDKDRTGSNLVKMQDLRLALAIRKNEFTKLTQQLLVKLSKFISSTKELLNSCIKGFIAAELAWMYACERTISRGFLLRIPVKREKERHQYMGDSIKALDSLSICLDLSLLVKTLDCIRSVKGGPNNCNSFNGISLSLEQDEKKTRPLLSDLSAHCNLGYLQSLRGRVDAYGVRNEQDILAECGDIPLAPIGYLASMFSTFTWLHVFCLCSHQVAHRKTLGESGSRVDVF